MSRHKLFKTLVKFVQEHPEEQPGLTLDLLKGMASSMGDMHYILASSMSLADNRVVAMVLVPTPTVPYWKKGLPHPIVHNTPGGEFQVTITGVVRWDAAFLLATQAHTVVTMWDDLEL